VWSNQSCQIKFVKSCRLAAALCKSRFNLILVQKSLLARIFAQQKSLYMIDVEIIEQLIGDLQLDSTTEDVVERTKRNAMNAFVLNEDDQVYVASVKSILKMNLIVKFVAVGVSFRQASRLYRLRQRLNDEKIERIDQQFRNMRLAMREEKGLTKILGRQQARADSSHLKIAGAYC
jgi:hypothetical protein